MLFLVLWLLTIVSLVVLMANLDVTTSTKPQKAVKCALRVSSFSLIMFGMIGMILQIILSFSL